MRKIQLCIFLFIITLIAGCSSDPDDGEIDPWYREAMRQFVINIRISADAMTNGFLLIPQNGHDIIHTSNGIANAYLAAIDGAGQEDLFYGYIADNIATPAAARDGILPFLLTARSNGITILITDYVSTPTYSSNSLSSNKALGFISFQAPDRELRTIPPVVNYENPNEIISLSEVSNFLYLLNPENYTDRTSYLTALSNAPHDLLIIDAFYSNTILSADEVDCIRCKPGTSIRRLVVAYMSIGEAEDYRYYWQSSWNSTPPSWLAGENPEWPGNYKVRYWDSEWQSIICNTTDSYLKLLIDSGFDGAYLDIIEAFEYFE